MLSVVTCTSFCCGGCGESEGDWIGTESAAGTAVAAPAAAVASSPAAMVAEWRREPFEPGAATAFFSSPLSASESTELPLLLLLLLLRRLEDEEELGVRGSIEE